MRLLLDVMCGKLARYLRMCGYDATYALDEGAEADDALCRLAAAEARRVVTRDETLAARLDGAVLLRSRDIDGQLRELRDAGFDLSLPPEPTRCGSCNGVLTRGKRDEPAPAYAPDPSKTALWRCRSCGRVFWKGSHWADVDRRLSRL